VLGALNSTFLVLIPKK
jgi:hypothetical protein